MRWRAALAVVVFTVAVTPTAHAEAPRPDVRRMSRLEPGKPEHRDLVILRRQMAAHPELPPVDFWYAIARCETNGEWDRGKDWGPRARSWVRGGLGIAWRSTWRNYGGLEFAKTPAHASKWAQIVVANRIGFLGWQTDEFRTWEDRVNNRPLFRDPAGFDKGWGGVCYRQWMKENRKP